MRSKGAGRYGVLSDHETLHPHVDVAAGFGGPDSAGVAGVTYRGETVDAVERPSREFLEPELLMYAKEAEIFRCVFHSGPLVDPRFTDWPPETVELECVDLNGDAVDEVVVTQWRTGASWAPGCAFVFKLGSDRLIRIATLTSHYEVKVERLDGFDQLVIPVTFAIGTTLAHAAQPRWTDYYRFDGQRIISSNSALPQRFRAWPGTLESVLTDHRDDPEIWYYLGVACRILGQGPELSVPLLRRGRWIIRSQTQRHTRLESKSARIDHPQTGTANPADSRRFRELKSDGCTEAL
jgi:hypothetical protein